MLWRKGSGELCGHYIKRPGHVGKGSVWVVVKIMGTDYHKPFMPNVSEGLITQRLEHWIFKRVAFFPPFPFFYWSRTHKPWRHSPNWLLNTTSKLLLWRAWKKIKQDLKEHSLLNEKLCCDTYVKCQSWFLSMGKRDFRGENRADFSYIQKISGQMCPRTPWQGVWVNASWKSLGGRFHLYLALSNCDPFTQDVF